MIKIDVRQLEETLKITPSAQNIMLVGNHGIGKSQIITEFYSTKKNMKVIAFFLGQMSDPGDLIGLMYKDQKTGHSEFLPPYWWPVDNKPIVLFLDELNRARPEILQTIMDLTLNKTLAGKKLPDGSIVVSAVNSGDQYQLTDLDPALISRFNIYDFKPSVEDWLIWATKKKIDVRVINFIQKNNHFLDGDDIYNAQSDSFAYGLEKTPDRRSWVRVSDIISNISNIEDIHIQIISGIVGVSAALNFKKSLKISLKINARDILLNFSKTKSKFKGLKLQDFIFLNEQIMYFINNKEYENKQKKILLKNFVLYIKYLKNTKMQEAVAHLGSMLENPKFENVTGFVLVDSVEIMEELADYISGIEI